MSSSEAFPSRRALLALGGALALGGCIEPMYGPTAGGGRDMAEELRAIAVDPIPERFGHYLGNELIFQLNGTGTPGPVKYRLLVTFVNRVQTPILDTVTGRADSATVWAEVNYTLTPAAGGRPVAEGKASAVADYDRSAARFANLRAARDAEIRAAKSLADQLRLRIAADLAKRPG
jgi:LPS-assembly lipoprotein